jgi:ATP-dependent Clp protease ATP-binding subunit ClpA
MRIERFTQRAQEAIAEAQQLAEGEGHPQLEVLHLLLILAEQPDGVVPAVLERVGVDALDVVHEQLGDERDVVANLLAALRQTLHIIPRRFHPLIGNVSQPAAKDGHPVSVSH